LFENAGMTIYSIRRRSFREVGRFSIIDQDGNPHILVERVAVLNDVGARGKVVDSERGASHFYSATTGDAVVRVSDESFVVKDGQRQLVLKKPDEDAV
jgi:hypothetical protein